MVERIAKVAPTKAVEYDVGRPFEQRHGFADSDGTHQFAEMLQYAIKKRQKKSAAVVSDPYVLDLSRATQSLFYRAGTLLPVMRKNVHE